MQLIRGLHNLKTQTQRSIVTIGNFDGLHRGHQHIIQKMLAQAAEQSLQTVVILFEPQPKEYFMRDRAPLRLMPLREKLRVLKQMSVDKVLCLYFNRFLEQLSPEDFIDQVIVRKLKVHTLWVGEDFRWGYRQQGDMLLLKKLAKHHHFQIISMPLLTFGDFRNMLFPSSSRGLSAGSRNSWIPRTSRGTTMTRWEMLYNKKISSTLIRKLLQEGQMEAAAVLLGRPFCLSGRVMRGDNRGRSIGFPTANVHLPPDYKGPLSGVYAVRVKFDSKCIDGVANMGVRPTFNGVNTVLEVHLFNFSNDIYGRHIIVKFLHKLRNEQRFDGIEALKQQIVLDVQQAKQHFADVYSAE